MHGIFKNFIPLVAFLMLGTLISSCKSVPCMRNASLVLTDSFSYNRQWQQAQLVVGTDTSHVTIRGRGHSTFMQPKHPYEIRWAKKTSFAGLPKHRHVALLANFFDHSLMRNALAMEVARQTSLRDITPQGNFVSLTVNGEWQGIYWASERVKDVVADSLLKLDVYHWEKQKTKGQMLDVLPKGMHIDTLSFVDWWLVHEVCMNAEPNGPRSCYVRVVADSVLKAGPVWDFDMAFNLVGVDDGGDLRPEKFKLMRTLPPFLQGKRIKWLTTDSLYCAHASIMEPFLHDRNFCFLAQKRWRELRPRLAALISRIDQWKCLLRQSRASADQQKWNAKEPARFDASSSWEEAVENLKRTYRFRLKTLGGQVSNLPLSQ